MSVAVLSNQEWISGLRARKALGIGYGALQRLAVLGKIRVLVEPGQTPRYNRSDVARLAN